MFERFTERARQVVVLAQDEARALKHNRIGTEHLLLGLLRDEEGIAARALTSLGLELEFVRAQVVRITGTGDEAPSSQMPFTRRAKKVLELALREAQALGHQYIGTEHVLLGLVREGSGVAAQTILGLGVELDRVRDEVIRTLGGPIHSSTFPGGTVRALATPAAAAGRWQRRLPPGPVTMLVAGWLLFAVALGVGILVGWAIWG